MRKIRASFNEFAKHIKTTNKKIVLFGAGTVGRILIPYLCKEYEMEERVLCYIDNNTAKQGRNITLLSKAVPVYSVEYLKRLSKGSFVLMITNGDFYPVLEQLEQISELQETEVYLAAVMQLSEKTENMIPGIYQCSDEPLIPKVIHYCWFGEKPIPENLLKCIDSWKAKCPDYEIIRWDESNYDVNKYIYTKQAYEMNQWGFIPDIARLEILYEYGGFYLDTDVELIKSLDRMRYQPGFCAREAWGHVNFGGGSGCRKGMDVVGEILEFRKDIPFILPNGDFNFEASGYFETKPLVDKGLLVQNQTQVVGEMTIYASEFFHPYNYITGVENITENTISIHYFSGTWLGEEGKKYRRQTRDKFQLVVDSLKGLEES